MYETKLNTRIVKGEEIETWEREIYDANVLTVEVGTNGYKGGDSGHGSRVYLRFTDEGGTDLNARVQTTPYGNTTEIEITLGGDAELSTMIKALKFAVKVLKEQSRETGK